MQRVAVIGLGRFGMALARQLSRSGAEVIAADMDMELVNEVRDDVAVAVRLDSTEQLALEAQEIDTVDAAVVAIGENFEAALLTTVILKKLGVPRIVCRAQTDLHAEIFRQIGATEVIQPEVQAGERLGHSLANPQLEDLVPLGEGYTLIELRAPREFHGKSLKALALRQTYDVNLITIRRPTAGPGTDKDAGYKVIGVPRSDELIQPGDVLIVVGSDEALARLPKE
jgi:trk system potassium uptake protein TrkA